MANDAHHINDVELVIMYNKHIKYLRKKKLGEETLFGNKVNKKMIDTMEKRKNVIKNRYIGPKYNKIATNFDKRIDNSINRRVNY